MAKTLILIFVFLFSLQACSANIQYRKLRADSSDSGRTSNLKKYYAGQVLTGMSSYYGKKFHGRKTSNGDTFDMYKLTAAHRFLPFNTIIEVTNLANSRSVRVRVNDRGPFVGNRILDLSYAAARKIGLTGAGVGKVQIRIIRLGEK